jgi:hypothetical protein
MFFKSKLAKESIPIVGYANDEPIYRLEINLIKTVSSYGKAKKLRVLDPSH